MDPSPTNQPQKQTANECDAPRTSSDPDNVASDVNDAPQQPAPPVRVMRPEAWEEDISKNALDTKPFENLPPISEVEREDLSNPKRLKDLEPWLAGQSLQSLVARDPFPIPRPEDRENYAPGYDGAYWLSGLEDFLKVMAIAKNRGIQPKSVFDFGCASGRLIRHYAAQTDIREIWGSDINRRHIRWLYENLPLTVRPIFNHCIPAIPLPDNSIDIITAFSVFTHIDTFETCWLAELARILSDDGFAYLTVHNQATWEELRHHVDNPENRLIQSMMRVEPTLRQDIMKPMPSDRFVYRLTQSGPYRAQVFHSNEYLKNVWGRFFEVVEILDLHHVRQSVVVLAKRR